MDTRNPTRRTLAKADAATFVAGPSKAQQPIPTDDPNAKANIAGSQDTAEGAVVPIKVTSQFTVTGPVSELGNIGR